MLPPLALASWLVPVMLFKQRNIARARRPAPAEVYVIHAIIKQETPENAGVS